MKWIRVEDEMPKISEDVLVHSKAFGVSSGFHAPWTFETGEKDKKEWLYRHNQTGTAFRVDDITHWMAYPDAPIAEIPIMTVEAILKREA